MDTDLSSLLEDFDCLADHRVQRIRAWLMAGRKPSTILASRICRHLGHAESWFLLGLGYLHWDNEAHGAAATRCFRRAARAGHDLGLGFWWARLGRQDWAQRLPALRCAAEAGDHDALRALIYLWEIWPEAPVIPYVVEQLELGAARGDPFSLQQLAKACTLGRHGLPVDDQRAFELWTRAAATGDPYSQCGLGTRHSLGRGTPINKTEAMRCYERGARGGHDWSMYFLGRLWHTGDHGLEPSMQEANRWYRRASLRGNASAHFELGLSLLIGRALPVNVARANSFFARAAREGDVEATFSLARSYHDRRGVTQSFTKAANLYAVAAKAGHKPSQLELAELLRYGVGVEKNVAEAERWLRLANEPSPD